MGGQSVDVEVGGFRVNLSSVQRGSVGDASIGLEFGEFLKHVVVANQKGVEVVRILRHLSQHLCAWRPGVVFGQDLVNQTHHHLLAQCFFEGGRVDHGAFESVEQATVFSKLTEFPSNVFWNHHDQTLGLSMMKENSMELI